MPDRPHTPPEAGPPSASRARSLPDGAAADALVQSLVRVFTEQLQRALSVRLDGSVETLAFVDHYLRKAEDEQREPILSLLAAGAGAYYGEMVREHIGATWVGDGKDPRRLRLLLEPQFMFFSPIDQAYEAITGTAIDPADPRVPGDPPFDPAFHLRAPEGDGDEGGAPDADRLDDAAWLGERLSELPPVPEDEFHSLTSRFETLKLMLELLAAKHAEEGRSPRRWGVSDYLEALG
jgi:hypothetical protein